MSMGLSAEDRILLDRLLSKLAGALDGAVDLWTTVCIGSIPPDPRAFILRNSEVLHSHTVVVRTFLAEARLADQEPQHGLLSTMEIACTQLRNAFLVLADFRTVPLDQLRSATETVAEAHRSMREAIRQLADSLGFSLSYLQGRMPEQDEYLQQIRRGLFDLFCHERGVGQAAVIPDAPRAS
jgi:hypothetical protein